MADLERRPDEEENDDDEDIDETVSAPLPWRGS